MATMQFKAIGGMRVCTTPTAQNPQGQKNGPIAGATHQKRQGGRKSGKAMQEAVPGGGTVEEVLSRTEGRHQAAASFTALGRSICSAKEIAAFCANRLAFVSLWPHKRYA
jgi:hypothetical protein